MLANCQEWSATFRNILSFSDSPEVQLDCSNVESSLADKKLQIYIVSCIVSKSYILLGCCIRYSGYWLLNLPIRSCGLKLDDEDIIVTDVGLHLSITLTFHTNDSVECKSMRHPHSFVCKPELGKASLHHASNDVIAMAFSATGVPAA